MVWAVTYRFPQYSTGFCLLQFPPGPLPCLHNRYQKKILQQGKGTDDHLLPLGEWLTLLSISFCLFSLSPKMSHPSVTAYVMPLLSISYVSSFCLRSISVSSQSHSPAPLDPSFLCLSHSDWVKIQREIYSRKI